MSTTTKSIAKKKVSNYLKKRKQVIPIYISKNISVDAFAPIGEVLQSLKLKWKTSKELSKDGINLIFGAEALKQLDKKLKFTETCGSVVKLSTGESIFPMWHPDTVVTNPTRLKYIAGDVKILSDIVTQTPVAVPEDGTVIRDEKQWLKFLKEYRKSRCIAVDIETTGLDPRAEGAQVQSIQIGLEDGRTYALPLCISDSPWPTKEEHTPKVRKLIALAKEKVVIGQNFKFDNNWLRYHYGRKFDLGFDTQLASHVLDENIDHGLKSLAHLYCQAPNYDVDLKTKTGQADLEQFYRYGCLDVYYTMWLYRIFKHDLDLEPGLRRLFYEVVMPVARVFEKVEYGGLHIDMPKYRKTRKLLVRELKAVTDELNSLAGHEVNWNSPKQIGEVLFSELGLPCTVRTASGAPSTGEAALIALKDKHPLPNLIFRQRELQKKLSTYIDGWKEYMHGDKLYLSTKISGTVTGRFSSRLHQVPRDPQIRSLITAPPGWVFVCADYSQIELRLAAHISGDPTLISVFQEDGDVHSKTASIILGKNPNDLTKEERKMAKAVNFGLLYGMGWRKLVEYAKVNYEVDMTDAQAQEFRRRFFETYFELPNWHQRCRDMVRRSGFVVSPSGRRRRLPGIYSPEPGIQAEAERQSINSPVQGFGSGDLKAMALVEIAQNTDWGSVRIKGEVHDSILLWIREESLARELPRIRRMMEQPRLLHKFRIRMQVPLKVDFEVGPWGQGEKYE